MTEEELNQILKDRGMTKAQLMKLLGISRDTLARMNRCTEYAIRYMDDYGLEPRMVRGKSLMTLWPGSLQELARELEMFDTQLYKVYTMQERMTPRLSMAFRWVMMERGIEL